MRLRQSWRGPNMKGSMRTLKAEKWCCCCFCCWCCCCCRHRRSNDNSQNVWRPFIRYLRAERERLLSVLKVIYTVSTNDSPGTNTKKKLLMHYLRHKVSFHLRICTIKMIRLSPLRLAQMCPVENPLNISNHAYKSSEWQVSVLCNFFLSIIFLWADRLGSMLDLQVSQPFAKFAENPVWIFQNLVFYSECYCITRLIVGASNYS